VESWGVDSGVGGGVYGGAGGGGVYGLVEAGLVARSGVDGKMNELDRDDGLLCS